MKLKPFYARGCLFLREIYAHENQKEKAVEHIIRAEEMFRDMGMDYWLGDTRKVFAGSDVPGNGESARFTKRPTFLSVIELPAIRSPAVMWAPWYDCTWQDYDTPHYWDATTTTEYENGYLPG